MVPPLGDVRSGPTADELRVVSPLPSIEGLLQDLLWAPVAPRSPDIADRRAPCSADQVPRDLPSLRHLPRMLRCWGMLRRRRVRRRRGTQALLGSAVAEDDVIKTMGETIACTDTLPTIIPPPAGFSQFSWPYEDWSVNDGQSLFTIRPGYS